MTNRCPCGTGTVYYDMGETPDNPYSRKLVGGKGWVWTCEACERLYGATYERGDVKDPPPPPTPPDDWVKRLIARPVYFYDKLEKAVLLEAEARRRDAAARQTAFDRKLKDYAVRKLSDVRSPLRYSIVAEMFGMANPDAAKWFIAGRRPPAVVDEAFTAPSGRTALATYCGLADELAAIDAQVVSCGANGFHSHRPRCVHMSPPE